MEEKVCTVLAVNMVIGGVLHREGGHTGHQISVLNTPDEPLPVIKCTLEVDASAGLAERSMRNEGHNLTHNTG